MASGFIVSSIFKVGVVGTSVFLVYWLTKNKTIRKLIFVHLTSKFGTKVIKKALEGHKIALFSRLGSMVSSDPVLRLQGKGVVRLLEIGIGSGNNLKYFPTGCHIIGIEPNEHFERFFMSNLSRFPDVVLEKCYQASAEDMSVVPSESIDVVVSTHVLCSVSNVQESLKEINRVLAPGGVFMFIEHTSYDPQEGWNRCLQKLAGPVWSFLSDGCLLDRDFEPAIISAGFRSNSLRKVLVNGVFHVMRPHIIGILTK